VMVVNLSMALGFHRWPTMAASARRSIKCRPGAQISRRPIVGS
jgi:hypothetical protein